VSQHASPVTKNLKKTKPIILSGFVVNELTRCMVSLFSVGNPHSGVL